MSLSALPVWSRCGLGTVASLSNVAVGRRSHRSVHLCCHGIPVPRARTRLTFGGSRDPGERLASKAHHLAARGLGEWGKGPGTWSFTDRPGLPESRGHLGTPPENFAAPVPGGSRDDAASKEGRPEITLPARSSDTSGPPTARSLQRSPDYPQSPTTHSSRCPRALRAGTSPRANGTRRYRVTTNVRSPSTSPYRR